MSEQPRKTVTLAVHRHDLLAVADVLLAQSGLVLDARQRPERKVAETRRWAAVAERFAARRRQLEELASTLDATATLATDTAPPVDPGEEMNSRELEALAGRIEAWRRRRDELETRRDGLAQQVDDLQSRADRESPPRSLARLHGLRNERDTAAVRARELAHERGRLVAESGARMADLWQRYATEERRARLLADHAGFASLVFFTGSLEPADEGELVHRVHAVAAHDHVIVLGRGPRRPRGRGPGWGRGHRLRPQGQETPQ